jgi:hypothetical protein
MQPLRESSETSSIAYLLACDPEKKPPPVIRIAHLPNAFSISLQSASARVMRWADAHASIDFTNSTGIRVQIMPAAGLPGA